MFTDSMSSIELSAEYEKDLPEITGKIERLNGSDYMNKQLWKARKLKTVSFRREIKSSRGNEYICKIGCENVGTAGKPKWNILTTYYGFVNTFKGVSALLFSDQTDNAIRITPHFFRRYKERMLDITADWRLKNEFTLARTQKDIVWIFMKRNPEMILSDVEVDYKHKSHIFAIVQDGAAMAEWDTKHKILQLNTFVTFDMLSQKQISIAMSGIEAMNLPEEERNKGKLPRFIEEELKLKREKMGGISDAQTD